MTTYETPPELAGKDYETWKKEVSLWQSITDLPAEKQAVAITLSLSGQYTEVATSINSELLKANIGVEILVRELDKHFKRESIDESYECYREFEHYVRNHYVSMSEYVHEFERRYNKLKKQGMAYPDKILGCKLLEMSNIEPQDKQMVLSAVSSIEFAGFNSGIKRICGSFGGINSLTGQLGDSDTIKHEAFVSSDSGSRPNKRKIIIGGKKVNPKGKDGKIMRCKICDSIYHWVRECPDNPDNDKAPSQEKYGKQTENAFVQNTTSVETGIEQQNAKREMSLVTFALATSCYLLDEAGRSAIVDTAGTANVCGHLWLDRFLSFLSGESRKLVKTEESHAKVMFGDMRNEGAIFKVTCPVEIAGIKGTVNGDNWEGSLPLLLSKAALKRAKCRLDVEKDTATGFGRTVKLAVTSSGHYLLPLVSNPSVSTAFVSITSLGDTSVQRDKAIFKLHRQFGHCSAKSLFKLLKNANVDCSETKIMKLVGGCENCKTQKKPGRKPVSSLPRANDANQVVVMDLHQLSPGLWFLHIIDVFSRYSVAVSITSKSAETNFEKFTRSWVSVFGPPTHAVLTDKGGELCNNLMTRLSEMHNMKSFTTAAYSPFSKGICERHNAVNTDTLNRVTEEFPELDLDTRLAYVCMSKNNLYNNNGFSLGQVMFGRNPSLPSVLVDTPPALSALSQSDMIAKHISLTYSTRGKYVQAENSDRVRRAVRHNVRSSKCDINSGDWVYFRRQSMPNWRGAGRVIGVDGKVIFVRHGSLCHRVHQRRDICRKY